MAEWKGFDQLDLTDVEAQGNMRLMAGRYITKVTHAEIKAPEGSKNRMLAVTFEDKGGEGDIRTNFNVKHSSEQAQEIALRQLKSFLVEAEHPSPDKPGDVKSLVGLEVGIVVGHGKPWTDRDGNSRTSTEVKRFVHVMKMADMQLGPDGSSPPNGGGKPSGGKTRTTSDDLSDDIPF
jgi:hypothetical protein